MEKSKIILASGSRDGKELLLQIGIVPEIIVSHVEERRSHRTSLLRS